MSEPDVSIADRLAALEAANAPAPVEPPDLSPSFGGGVSAEIVDNVNRLHERVTRLEEAAGL
jgi:hypothetical protein